MAEEREWPTSRTDEARRREITDGDARPELQSVPIVAIPFQARQWLSRQKMLDEWYPRGKAPWTRVQCGIGGRWHDTGVEMRLEREPSGRWWVKVRPGDHYEKVSTIVASEHEPPEAKEPSWWEIRCRACMKPTRRDPIDFLGDQMFVALVEYRSRLATEDRTRARRWPPQLPWTSPSA